VSGSQTLVVLLHQLRGRREQIGVSSGQRRENSGAFIRREHSPPLRGLGQENRRPALRAGFLLDREIPGEWNRPLGFYAACSAAVRGLAGVQPRSGGASSIES